MTKHEMITEIINASGLTARVRARQMEEAYERFLKCRKEYIEHCYKKFKEGAVTPVFILRCATHIQFREA